MSTRFAWSRCRKVICIGRNYVDHAKELSSPIPETPMFFLKPSSSLITQGSPIELPGGIGEVHHEVELGVVIGKQGKCISEENAMDHVGGYALGIDVTARDLQGVAKSKGLPWTVAKGYDTFCPISTVIDADALGDPHDQRLWLKVNGETKQDGHTSSMIFNIPRLIHAISNVMTLETNDLILTGTPAGVGPIVPGDTVTAGISDVCEIAFPVVAV